MTYAYQRGKPKNEQEKTQKQINHLKKQNRKLRQRNALQYERGFIAGCEATHAFWEEVLSSTKGVGEKTRNKIMLRAKELAEERTRKGEENGA